METYFDITKISCKPDIYNFILNSLRMKSKVIAIGTSLALVLTVGLMLGFASAALAQVTSENGGYGGNPCSSKDNCNGGNPCSSKDSCNAGNGGNGGIAGNGAKGGNGGIGGAASNAGNTGNAAASSSPGTSSGAGANGIHVHGGDANGGRGGDGGNANGGNGGSVIVCTDKMCK
jgi:hypothetical protein